MIWYNFKSFQSSRHLYTSCFQYKPKYRFRQGVWASPSNFALSKYSSIWKGKTFTTVLKHVLQTPFKAFGGGKKKLSEESKRKQKGGYLKSPLVLTYFQKKAHVSRKPRFHFNCWHITQYTYHRFPVLPSYGIAARWVVPAHAGCSPRSFLFASSG